MSEPEMQAWADANGVLVRSRMEESAWPCDDCTFAFALEMRLEGRCDGEPLGHVEDPRELQRLRHRAHGLQVVLAARRAGATWREAAAEAGVHVNTARQWVRGGVIDP